MNYFDLEAFSVSASSDDDFFGMLDEPETTETITEYESVVSSPSISPIQSKSPPSILSPPRTSPKKRSPAKTTVAKATRASPKRVSSRMVLAKGASPMRPRARPTRRPPARPTRRPPARPPARPTRRPPARPSARKSPAKSKSKTSSSGRHSLTLKEAGENYLAAARAVSRKGATPGNMKALQNRRSTFYKKKVKAGHPTLTQTVMTEPQRGGIKRFLTSNKIKASPGDKIAKYYAPAALYSTTHKYYITARTIMTVAMESINNKKPAPAKTRLKVVKRASKGKSPASSSSSRNVEGDRGSHLFDLILDLFKREDPGGKYARPCTKNCTDNLLALESSYGKKKLEKAVEGAVICAALHGKKTIRPNDVAKLLKKRN